MTPKEQLEALYGLTNSVLQQTEAIKRVTGFLERGHELSLRERQELHDLRIAFETFIPELRYELRQIGERLAVLTKGVDNVAHDVDDVSKDVAVVHSDISQQFTIPIIPDEPKVEGKVGVLMWFLKWWGRQPILKIVLLIVLVIILALAIALTSNVVHPPKVLE